MLKITASAGWLCVEVETDHAYPDIADDLTNRAIELLREAVAGCAEQGWNPMAEYEANEE